jgi:GNAT superfamily N-acetyltransferase
MNVGSLTEDDLPSIKQLQPGGWSDILPHTMFYLKASFCFPIKVLEGDTIAGIGTTILHGRTAWLAHIIVHPDYRNRGVGKLITQTLVDSLKNTSCETVLLIATVLGEPVYKKLGFEKETEYIFLKDGNIPSEHSADIVSFSDHYRDDLLNLDRQVSGEVRHQLLLSHLASAHLFVKDQILLGYYLPYLGDGLVIAKTPEAGLALLTLRSTWENKFVLPLDNKTGLDFLLPHGYQEYSRGARMWLGKKLTWDPTMLYNRIGGNFG